MADDIRFQLNGVEELVTALRAIPEVLGKRVLRNALAKAARVIRDTARANAPVLRVPSRRRKPGTVHANIVVRTSKIARVAGDIGVYVSVRPLRGARTKKLGRAGAANPNDPYYWWWQEFGWTPNHGKARTRRQRRAAAPRRVPGRRFLTGAAISAGERAIDVFMKDVVPQIEKLNRKGALNVG